MRIAKKGDIMNSVDGFKESIAFFNSFPRACKASNVAGITSAVTYALARIAQIFTGTSDDRQFAIYSKRINDFTNLSRKKCNVTFQKVNSGLFLYLSNKKFISLVKKGALLYFEQKIKNKEDTLESVNKTFNAKFGSLNEIFAKVSIKEICSIVPIEDLVKFIERSPLRQDWRDFQVVTQRYVDSKAARLVEKCQQKFIGLFPKKELEKPLSWKIFFAKQLVDIKEAEIPSFAKDFLAELKSGLPERYEENVRLFTSCQSSIVNVVQRKILAVRAKVFEQIPIAILAHSSAHKTESEDITDELRNCIDLKYTEQGFVKPTGLQDAGFAFKYMRSVNVAKIIRDCFMVYRDRNSECDF